MTVKNLFIFDAIVLLLFGLPLIFAPQALAKIVFIDTSLTDVVIATFRSYGVILLSLALAVFSARNLMPCPARRGLLTSIAIADTIISLITIYAIVTGIENNTAWGIVILTGVVGIWAMLLLLKEKEKQG
jgi:uncharacterized membrane protein